MSKEILAFQQRIADFSARVENKIPAGFVANPTEIIFGCDKEDASKYRCINNSRLYKFELIEKYKDNLLGHATNSSGIDVLLFQINRFAHFQTMAATHPLDNKVLGFKTYFFTKGGKDFDNFISENENLEETINERKAGFLH